MASSGDPGQRKNFRSTFAIAAALGIELAPFRKGRYNNCQLLETGMGVANARRSLRSFLRHHHVSAIASVGVAGSLSPDLEVGDLVIARQLLNQVNMQPSPKLAELAETIDLPHINIYSGSVVTVDEIIHKAEQRQSLAKEFAIDGTAILDMESTAVAEICAEFQTPFMIIRSISDRFDEDLPINFNKCVGNDGNVALNKILLAILLNPLAIKGLLIMRKRCKYCTNNLVSFINQFLPSYNAIVLSKEKTV